MLLSLMGNIINHDIKLYIRKGGELTGIIGFFVICMAFFPFAIGVNSPMLANAAIGFMWIVALLASLLALPSIFYRDAADGSLDLLRLSPIALEWVALAKCIAHWLGCQLPLIFITPIAATMLGLEQGQAARLTLSLLVGTPILSLIGGLCAALTLHSANKAGVMAVLALPLYIPTLIFAAASAASDPNLAAFSIPSTLFLSGILLLALPLSVGASAWIIRLQD